MNRSKNERQHKGGKRRTRRDVTARSARDADAARRADSDSPAAGKLPRKDYEKELAKLHGELVTLQRWVQATGAKIVIVFEGRDGAGKGGTIKALTERVSPRVFRVVALPAPTRRERSQMYLQRYVPHLPAAGEIVIFDRSWYNRAGVERVMGLCTEEEAREFLKAVPLVEQAVVDSGVVLLKYWLEVSPDEQTRRLKQRIHDNRKIWKLSDMDLKSYSRWFDYSRARDEMFAASDTGFAPWFVVRSDDKKRARLNLIRHLLDRIPYEEVPRKPVKLPKRQKPRRISRVEIYLQVRRGALLSRPPRCAASLSVLPGDRERIAIADHFFLATGARGADWPATNGYPSNTRATASVSEARGFNSISFDTIPSTPPWYTDWRFARSTMSITSVPTL